VERATGATVATPADLPRPPEIPVAVTVESRRWQEEIYARLCAMLEKANYDEATCVLVTDVVTDAVKDITPELAGRLRDHIASRSLASTRAERDGRWPAEPRICPEHSWSSPAASPFGWPPRSNACETAAAQCDADHPVQKKGNNAV